MAARHVEFLVEELSMEAALLCVAPRILPIDCSFKVYVHQGKSDLLGKLPARFKGYQSWIPQDWRIAVLVDEDRQDCQKLKQRLELAALNAGFTTAASAGGKQFQVLNRIAVEELEAWFFGDTEALRQAYPRLPATIARKAKYRHPDAIAGGTWEALERELQAAGYYTAGLAKVEVARRVAEQMQPNRNISPSFATFVAGVTRLIL